MKIKNPTIKIVGFFCNIFKCNSYIREILCMMKERILCAAIWYKELPLTYSDFPSTHLLPVNCECGIVFCGLRHLQCLYQMIAMTGKKQHEVGEEIQGFLTSKNKFVDRKEGMKIALDANQVINAYHGIALYSEDLY